MISKSVTDKVFFGHFVNMLKFEKVARYPRHPKFFVEG